MAVAAAVAAAVAVAVAVAEVALVAEAGAARADFGEVHLHARPLAHWALAADRRWETGAHRGHPRSRDFARVAD